LNSEVTVVDEVLWVFAALGAIAFAPIVAAGVVARVFYKRVRRSPAIGGAVLRTRARLKTGPQRRVLQLRVRLKETLDSGQAAVDLASRSEGPRGELPRLFGRLRKEATALDSQLRLMESETDPAVLAAELPAASRRVDLVAESLRGLRAAVASGLGEVSDDSLTALRSDVDREVAALHAGVQELRALNRRDRFAGPAPLPSADGLNPSR
jgi:hypothetical protein